MYANENDITVFVLDIQKKRAIKAMDLSTQGDVGGKVQSLQWVDGIFAVKCQQEQTSNVVVSLLIDEPVVIGAVRGVSSGAEIATAGVLAMAGQGEINIWGL